MPAYNLLSTVNSSNIFCNKMDSETNSKRQLLNKSTFKSPQSTLYCDLEKNENGKLIDDCRQRKWEPEKESSDIPLYFEVTLNKINDSLGLSLAISDFSLNNEGYLFVKDIIPNSSAFYDGRIEIGDKIVMINKEPVCNKKMSEICHKIKCSPSRIVIGLLRLNTVNYNFNENGICWHKPDVSYTKYTFKMPLGFVIDDIGLIIDLCCGLNETSMLPCVFAMVNTVLADSLFPMLETSLPKNGQIIYSLIGISLENMNEKTIIQKIKSSYLKLIQDGHFEMDVYNLPHSYRNVINIFENCLPSFFIYDDQFENYELTTDPLFENSSHS
ncbi:hypothetical protein MXB_2280, partial [Myxobolus squamalis]